MTRFLVDLSSIAYPLWHMNSRDPDPNRTAIDTVARVLALASGQPHVAVCCDSGKSFRHDLDPTYKANRPEPDAPRQHQISLAMDDLRLEGFPVWSAKGFEADDIIASAIAQARALAPDDTFRIATADKDLLQLVDDKVVGHSLKDGSTIDALAVNGKFGVSPSQMLDYLTLVGDTSDNVKGVDGIGEKKAAMLLQTFGSLDGIYKAIIDGNVGNSPLTDGIVKSLLKFEPVLANTRALLTLRTDVPLPIDELMMPRQTPLLAALGPLPAPVASIAPPVQPFQNATSQAITVYPAPVAPLEWERQLEPRSLIDARALAADMFTSKLFSTYGHMAGILATILAGRELGMPAMASLRGFHIVEGKPTLAADLIRGLVMKSGKAKFFRVTERSATVATFETQRGRDPVVKLSYTIEEATQAGLIKSGSGWVKNPADMLVARAGAKLARLVYPDVCAGLYAPEELINAA